jgi:hypothetical protein
MLAHLEAEPRSNAGPAQLATASETYTLDLYPYHPKNLQIQDTPKHNFLTTRDSTVGEDHHKCRMSKPKSKRALTDINLYYFSSSFCSGTILFL